MLKKIQVGLFAAVLALTGCSSGRYGPSPAYYILPSLIGVGVGVGGALLINGMSMHSQREMMKDQTALQQSHQSAQAATQRCSGQDNLFAATWKECNKHPHSDACLQDQENLDKYCMPPSSK